MTDKRYVKPTGPVHETSDEDLRELGRRLFDEINIDRLDEQVDDQVSERERPSAEE